MAHLDSPPSVTGGDDGGDDGGDRRGGQPPATTGERRSGPLASRIAAAVAVGGALAPMVLLLARVLADAGATFLPWGDDALIELNSRDLLRGRHLLGVYSRFGWHHPGPAALAALAPAVVLLGDGPGLLLGAVLWNGAVAVGMLAYLWRRRGPAGAVAGAAALAVVVRGAPPDTFQHPWNPYLVLLPMLFLLVVVADLVATAPPWGPRRDGADGRDGPAPPAVAATRWLLAALLATFAVQAHISTGPTAAALLVVAAAAAGSQVLRAGGARRALAGAARPAPLLLAAALVVLWALPAYEAVTAEPSNPGLILRFFREGHPGTSLADATSSAAAAMSAFPFGFEPHSIELGRGRASLAAGAAVLAVLAAAGAWIGWRRRSPWVLSLVGVGALTAVLAVAANTRVTGGIHNYLVVWQEAVPALLVMAVGHGLAAPRPPARSGAGPGRRRDAVAWALAAAVAALGTSSTLHVARAAPPRERTHPHTAPLVRAVERVLRPTDRSVLLRFHHCDVWPIAAGVAVALEREGRQVSVTGPICAWGTFATQFDHHRDPDGTETVQLDWVQVDASGQPPATVPGTPLPGTYHNAAVGFRYTG